MSSKSDRSSTSIEETLGELHHREWGRLISVLTVRTRRIDLVEDAVGEAFARAAARWPADGVPDNPVGWLHVTAYRLVVGSLRAEAIAGRKAPLLVVRDGVSAETQYLAHDELPDQRLHLILLCCHPALDPAARSALALRLVIGTPTAEIARLFLVRHSAMAARLTRAKRKIVAAGIPLGMPVGRELDTRIESVARTIYLAFTAAYTPGYGEDLLRPDAAGDAVRLAATLHELVPHSDVAGALLALLVLQHARRDARVEGGRLVPLAQQDRTRWHRGEIDAGLRLLESLPASSGYAEELRLQAVIAAEHDRAPTARSTAWAAIERAYGRLEAITGSPVVRLNRAVALAEVGGPAAGLEILVPLAGELDASHRFHAVRGDLLRRTGRLEEARSALESAIRRCGNETERAFLSEKLRDVGG